MGLFFHLISVLHYRIQLLKILPSVTISAPNGIIHMTRQHGFTLLLPVSILVRNGMPILKHSDFSLKIMPPPIALMVVSPIISMTMQRLISQEALAFQKMLLTIMFLSDSLSDLKRKRINDLLQLISPSKIKQPSAYRSPYQ